LPHVNVTVKGARGEDIELGCVSDPVDSVCVGVPPVDEFDVI
jgi:hypothetical protein